MNTIFEMELDELLALNLTDVNIISLKKALVFLNQLLEV